MAETAAETLSQTYKALVIGATGATGKALVANLLKVSVRSSSFHVYLWDTVDANSDAFWFFKSPTVSKVTILVRRKAGDIFGQSDKVTSF